jgi:hypothetical protein
LVERARGGDGEAWSQIVRELGPRVQGYARGKGVVDAEDVVQDVFIAAARRIGDFDGDDQPARSRVLHGGEFVPSAEVLLSALRSGDRRPDAEFRFALASA